MKVKKVIVEIDGERHRLVKPRKILDSLCLNCSLLGKCPICCGPYHFVKEKKQRKGE